MSSDEIDAKHLVARLGALSQEQQELFNLLLQRKRLSAPGRTQITPRPDHSKPFPLSSSQLRMWFLQNVQTLRTSYNSYAACRLEGKLNVGVLEWSINRIVQRHEVLRSVFPIMAGHPVQLIQPELCLSLPVINLSSLDSIVRDSESERLMRRACQRPFDLARGPNVRPALLRLQNDEHILLLIMHQIVTDGWSQGVLLNELAECYEARLTGRAPKLKDLTIQYADFALWEKELLAGDSLQRSLSYWKEQLSGVLPVLNLARDGSGVPSEHGASQSMKFSPELSAAIKKLSLEEGVTPFMTLLAAFQTLLYRYTGQDDIIVGTPSAGRNRPELEPLIGPFINPLALRTNLGGNPQFRELLKRVRAVTLSAYAHQELPFDKLVEELQPQRDLNHMPLFQVMLIFQNAPLEKRQLPEVTLTPLVMDSGTAKFDLVLSIVDHDGQFTTFLEYRTDLFGSDTIARMNGHFQTLLEGIVFDHDRRLSALPLLSDGEVEQQRFEWNPRPSAYPRDKCIHELFVEQVGRTPDAIAVRFKENSITYRELNGRANQLAHVLQCMEIGPEDMVAVMVQPSIELVISLLGVLKTGAAYVPLDPGYPAGRLDFMLRECQGSALITQPHLLPSDAKYSLPVLCLDETLTDESPSDPGTQVCPDNLAYALFTSGSTGAPKAVMISHRALVNLLWSMREEPGLGEDDVLLSVTSISFDIAALELFLPLVTGAHVVLVTRETAADSESLAVTLRESKTTVMQATPTTWQSLVSTGWRQERDLKILCGGETLPAPLARKLIENSSSVWNLYGPTETTIWSARSRVKPEQRVVIGKAIHNTHVYILDPRMELLPAGSVGELYIGGEGLARGYLGQPALTAERYVPHPFSVEAGARLYRTGDQGRYLADGNIEFLGRRDNQVKLRGYRIELGEVEAALRGLEGVQQAVVVRKGELADCEAQLWAYVVGDEELRVSELRAQMQQKLPPYMLPAGYEVRERLPLLPNGKVDRGALAAEAVEQEAAAEIRAQEPRTVVEELLMGIWSEVLRRKEVGINENFFALGGHSLLATQLISRVRERLGVELPLRSVFEAPTVTKLAERVKQALHGGENGPQMPPLVRQERGDEMPLSYAQERLWFLDQLQPGNSFYNLPVAMQLTGELNYEALKQSIAKIVERQAVLRTSFLTVEGKTSQFVAEKQRIELPVIDLSELGQVDALSEAFVIAAAEAKRPFDLSRAPLFRTTLLQVDQNTHLMLLTMHHIISDGWSMRVCVAELAAVYEAACGNTPSTLPDLSIDYRDFAAWQREYFHGGVLESQISYWQQQLAGIPELLELPADRPRTQVQTYNGARYSLNYSESLLPELKNLARQEGVTLFMVLLAAFQSLLNRYTGQDQIVIGCPIANRNTPEQENLVGCFMNMLAMRGDLSGTPTFRELLRQVREVALGAYAHQDLPFSKLVEELRPKRNLSYPPIFQVVLAFQNERISIPAFHNLEVSFLDIFGGTSVYDLILSLSDTQNTLGGAFTYNTDLFNEWTISTMANHLEVLLNEVTRNPDVRIHEISLFGEISVAQRKLEAEQFTT
jgi:amino acid adenylation domain-containing protein